MHFLPIHCSGAKLPSEDKGSRLDIGQRTRHGPAHRTRALPIMPFPATQTTGPSSKIIPMAIITDEPSSGFRNVMRCARRTLPGEASGLAHGVWE